MKDRIYREVGVRDREETELIHRCQAGEADAWSALLKQHHRYLFSIAYRITLNAEEAEDSLQDSWVRIAKSLTRFDGRSSFRTWATRIVVRQALTHRQSKRPYVPLEDTEMMGEPPKTEPTFVEGLELKDALSSLSEEERTAVVLHYVEGYTFQEVANCLDLPLRTAADLAYRGIKRMRQKLTTAPN